MTQHAIDWAAPMHKIAIFRALNLGDMLCAMPALRALRKRLPKAHITLIGLKSARPLIRHYSDYVNDLVEFPGHSTFPEQPVHHSKVPEFYRAMRTRRFDMILQMHGSGHHANDIVSAMAPRQWAGFVPTTSGAIEGRLLPWPEHLHEIHRYLALLRHIGLDSSDDTLDFPITPTDKVLADSLAAWQDLDLKKTIFVHPGARLASRRWPLERYALVARALHDAGWQVVITGSDEEQDLARRLRSQAGRELVNLCGATPLGVLASLLQRARLLICNDTGISHLAASVRLPSVVIASGSDVTRWAPLDMHRHTVVHAQMDCRPCAWDECPYGHPCAYRVEVKHVLAQVHRHLQLGGQQ